MLALRPTLAAPEETAAKAYSICTNLPLGLQIKMHKLGELKLKCLVKFVLMALKVASLLKRYCKEFIG